eukprot:756578-Hanusia_phi.AAC.3
MNIDMSSTARMGKVEARHVSGVPPRRRPLHHPDAEGEENRNCDGPSRHSPAVPGQADEGSELWVAPLHVAGAGDGGGEAESYQRLQRPVPQEPQHPDHRRHPNAQPDGQDQDLGHVVEDEEEVGRVTALDQVRKRPQARNRRLRVRHEDADGAGDDKDVSHFELLWKLLPQEAAQRHDGDAQAIDEKHEADHGRDEASRQRPGGVDGALKVYPDGNDEAEGDGDDGKHLLVELHDVVEEESARWRLPLHPIPKDLVGA